MLKEIQTSVRRRMLEIGLSDTRKIKLEKKLLSGLRRITTEIGSCKRVSTGQHTPISKVSRVLGRAVVCLIWFKMRRLKAAKQRERLRLSDAYNLFLAPPISANVNQMGCSYSWHLTSCLHRNSEGFL